MNISVIEVPKGNREYMKPAWEVKERIRKEQGLLNQPRHFFYDTYIDGESYIAVTDEQRIVGFGVVIQGSYLALLGVNPKNQGSGIGGIIMSEIMSEREYLKCHTRTENDKAIQFYKDLGFIESEIDENYYEDNEDASIMVYLKK